LFHKSFKELRVYYSWRMRMTRLKIAILVTVFLFSFLVSTVEPTLASTYQVVNVMVAYDEELATTAGWVYGYSPEVFCRIIVEAVSWRFEEEFGIMFRIVRYVAWSSNDSITESIEDLLYDCINKTGFYSGMTYNTIPIDVLIAFSDQETSDGAGGVAKYRLGAVLVFEVYHHLSFTQYTDNILQHELTHLYTDWLTQDLELGSHHWIPPELPGYDCVMNIYPIYIPFPEDLYRPYGMTTENWCNTCKERIMSMKNKWGREQLIGGGPTYPVLPYVEEVQEAGP